MLTITSQIYRYEVDTDDPKLSDTVCSDRQGSCKSSHRFVLCGTWLNPALAEQIAWPKTQYTMALGCVTVNGRCRDIWPTALHIPAVLQPFVHMTPCNCRLTWTQCVCTRYSTMDDNIKSTGLLGGPRILWLYTTPKSDIERMRRCGKPSAKQREHAPRRAPSAYSFITRETTEASRGDRHGVSPEAVLSS